MRKRFVFILVILCCSILFTGCSDTNSMLFYSEVQTEDSLTIKYKSFTGESYDMLDGDTIQIDSGEVCTLKFDVITEDGTLSISIVDSNGNTVHKKENIATSNFEFKLDKKGSYHIYLNGNKHKGSIKVSL